MNQRPPYASVIDPITPAIDGTRIMLFKPFDLRKWFVIGFCVWLACLGSGGGPHFNFPQVQHRRQGFEPDQALDQAKEFISCNLAWLIPVVVFVALLIIGLWLVFTWLSSRGRFMFLHCVAQNKAHIKVPWTKFRQHANSLFLFRIVLGLIGFAVIFLPTLLAIVLIALAASHKVPVTPAVVGAVSILLVATVPWIVLFLVHKFTTEFVVPIMFLRTTSCRAAWREFLALLSANKGRFTLYILFQILIGMAIGVIGASVACLFSCLLLCFTCGVACCLMIIPPFSIGFGYVITVLLLPLSVFKRAYSLHYFRQYGPEFDVFVTEIEPALPA